MKAINQFFKSMLEAIIEARKARADQLVNSLGHGKQ
jgi:hypothetical protein